MPNRMVSIVRSVLTKAMSRIAPPQWGQTISLPKVRLSNSFHGIYFLRPTFDFVSIASCLSATSGVVSNPEFTGSTFGLVDSPRRSEILADNIEALGGVRWLYLTHGDDVADHQFWQNRFGCERILHSGDVTAGTRAIERILQGEKDVRLTQDLTIIPVPGHTQGSTALLFRDTYLFTGDHLAFSKRRGHLYAFKDACWHSWAETLKSMEKLRAYSFTWILPGHGRRYHAGREKMQVELETCIRWMRDC